MLKATTSKQFFKIYLIIGIAFLFLVPLSLMAADTPLDKKAVDKIRLVMEKSQILPIDFTPKRIYVVEPKILRVDERALKETGRVLLIGLAPGTTNLAVWKSAVDKDPLLFDIEVVSNTFSLKEQLHLVFPQEKDIQVTAASDYLTLSGTVSSATTASQVVELAKVYAPAATQGGAPKLINLLEVGGVQQVMLEVRVSEMSRTLARRLGVNFSVLSASGQQFGLSLLNNLVALPAQGWPGNPLQVTNSVNGILNFLGDGASWTVFIDALKEDGLLKVLAEPTLITLSGKEAKFLAGGEFPVPVPDSDGRVTISYKPFGVGLTFTPIVLSNNKISMQVAPEVSELDFTTAITLQGFIIPSITTRRVATTVELADGQSFAIAGLIKEEMRESIKKFPLLGDIPVLGALFRSSSYQKRDSELIIIVTPHLVKPVDMTKQTLPTDQFVEPNDFEFYLLGHTEGRGEPRSSGGATTPADQSGGKLEGKFGHITP